ncbi:DUF3526 domain-containing protein [Hymenobacter lapidiphilus]|uniref:DUF3526 domain-containing protein n=1 Tax=Hymenobacter sp. CCM 8763 TaxID=2303334 RepID=UPI000E35013D|nr:DUF3526 domain-containing protein [Hymenobacter sp. CCM 8763]RFP64316.1 DUF3526 domain-containing protein [Hymenobacter sp. CCM 8763]
MWKTVFAHEWQLFRRSKLLVGGLLFLLLTGAYGLYAGHAFAQTQRAVLRGIDASQAARLTKHLARFRADTLTDAGKRDWRWAHDAVVTDRELNKIVYQPLAPLAGLSIGQRDVYPYYYPAVPWDNANEGKTTEIRNPDKLLAGNFDLAFVLIFLVPLFLIAYGHNVLSEEQEQHTYALLRVQAGSVRAVVGYKLLFRVGLTLAAVWALSGAGFLLNRVPGAQLAQMVGWLLVSLLYVGFWGAATYAVAALGRGSAFNALTLLSVWVLVLLLIPSTLNYALSQRQTDPESMRLVSLSRKKDGPWYWRMPRLTQAFQQAAPRFAQARYAPARDTSEFRFVAYVELEQQEKNAVGAVQAREQAALYEQTLGFNLLNPAYTALNACNQLAQTELNHHQDFVRAVLAYQQQRRYFSFDYDLSGKPFGRADLNKFPEFDYQSAPTSLGAVGWSAWPLLLWAVGLALFGYRRLARVR